MSEVFKTSKYRSRFKELQDEFAGEQWMEHYNDISENMLPRRSQYLVTDQADENPGGSKNGKIINGVAGKALITLAAGMLSGLTSPSLPWFALSVEDKKLRDNKNVRIWLSEVTDILLNIFQKSNFYGAIWGRYLELGAYGTAAMLIEEDFDTTIRIRPFTIGEYSLALDARYRPDSLYRRFTMTARQIVEKFGGKQGVNNPNLSLAVKNAMENGRSGEKIDIRHCIQPRGEFEPGDKTDKRLAYEDIYYEENHDDKDIFLRKGGFRSKPFVAPRWGVIGTDAYGESPGMDVLGDVKMLQKMETDKLKALDKMVDPPMTAPSTMKGKHATIIAGGVTYDDSPQATGFRPTFQIQPDLRNIAFEIDRVERRINSGLFSDLFLAIISEDKSMTATEVRERHAEKLVVLGPVLERLQSEMLAPTIERTFEIANSLGKIPPRPSELGGSSVNIKYVSVLAQAQKASGVTAVAQTASFVGSLVSVFPSAADKFNAEEAVDEYSQAINCPPKIIRSDKEVAQIQQARAQAQEREQQRLDAESAAKGAQGAKVLSETQTGGNSVLDLMLGS